MFALSDIQQAYRVSTTSVCDLGELLDRERKYQGLALVERAVYQNHGRGWQLVLPLAHEETRD